MATSINYVPQTELDFSGPAWNNSNEYPSLISNEFTYDQQQLDSLMVRIQAVIDQINGQINQQTNESIANQVTDLKKKPSSADDSTALVLNLQAMTEMEDQAWDLLGNLRSYAHCLTCVDGANADANASLSHLTSLSGKLEALTKPVSVYLLQAPEAILEKYFEHAHVRPHEFRIRHEREMAETVLTELEESLIARLKANGPMAFGSLYDQLSSNIRCLYENPQTKEVQQIGLAQAAGLIRDSDPMKRKNAWRSIQLGWRTQETSAASILNALAGWRLELNEQRSKRRRHRHAKAPALHFLDLPLHKARIKRETLDAMMSAVTSKKDVGRRANHAMAQALGKSKLDPWDLLAPAPTLKSSGDPRLTFEKGIALIRDAFESADPSFADFVDTMKKNRWIEGRQLATKRPGAFCTGFPKSNSPRVFQTYMGSMNDIRTLAHELGHAYHSWVMKDLPRGLKHYPMTIAETASIFAETAFSDSMMSQARASNNHSAMFEIAWQNAESAASHILNIPARFDFEVSFYERRKLGYVGPEELSQLMKEAWEKWYGDTLSEMENQYWMTKLHFSIAGMSFYNFPYTFGALFSLGIYALREERGQEFWPAYIALLRDTGRMTAEDLARKHLDVDLTKEDFWLKSLAIVDSQVTEFESLAY
jgi:oligoendopeptidase F